MMRKWTVLSVLALSVLAAAYGLYYLGTLRGMSMSAMDVAPGSSSGAAFADADPQSDREVLYWHDPMVPGYRFDEPGPSPFMRNMMLVPVYADESEDDTGVVVDSRIQQNLGIRLTAVVRGSLTPRVDASGNVAFNERDQVVLEARATAYVERLHVRATLDRVERGQPLADIYVPEWVAAQEEYLSLRRLRGSDLDALSDNARQRMRQFGMTEEQIALVESSGVVQPRVTLTAPIAGVLVEVVAREGMTLMPGETLFRINGFATVWVNVEVPEGQARLLRPGAVVEARSPALPDMPFEGTLQAILPEVTQGTRTLRARLEIDNAGGVLAPGMYVSASIAAATTEGLLVPSEAVLVTGTRSVVMLAEPGGTFRAVDVEAGLEHGGLTEIRRGLQAGDRVVVSGQFLIDSEASLRATGTRMRGPSAGGNDSPVEPAGPENTL